MTRKNRLEAFLVAALFLVACQEAPTTPAATTKVPNGPAAFTAKAPSEQVMEGEVLVKVRDDADIDAVAREHGLARGQMGRDDAFVVMHGQSGNEHGKAAELKADSRVVYAEPNYLRE